MSRKKVAKYRGSKTHGGGSMKKRRGAGHRGGRGRSGSGKKGDQKKPSYWKESQLQKGFHSVKRSTKAKSINISTLASKILKLESQSLVKKKGSGYEVNLKEMGFTKLLGTGNTKLNLTVTVEQASKAAIEKINKAGGSVNVLQQEKAGSKETVSLEPKKAEASE